MEKKTWAQNFFAKPAIAWIISIIGIFLVILAAYLLGFVNSYHENTIMNIGINMILAVGLNLVVGYAGQFSLGHAGFMAIGAYVTALVSQAIPGPLGFMVGMLAGAVITGLVALLVGIPTLRLRGDYLAIATLGVSEIIRITIMNLKITNGAAGIAGIPNNVTWITLYVFIVITTLVTVNYIHSSPGRATIAVRSDEIAAESVGVNTTKYKLIAFITGAITASMAGALYAGYFGVINPSQFTFQKSIDILIIVVFGGIGSVTGSFVAAIVLGLLNTFLSSLGQLRMIIYAIAIIVIMVWKPTGLMGEFELSFRKLFERKENKSDKETEDE